MLSAEEIEQAEYVMHATAAGGIARGTVKGSAACGKCPCCARPLDALSPECAHCGSEIVVCSRERTLCDARAATFCTLCGAVAGGAARREIAHCGNGLHGATGSV